MRGIFAAGVLDVFLEHAFHPFAFAIGASAGACNLSSHLAGQHERNLRCYTTQMARDEFVSMRRFLRGGHWLDLDYLWDAFAREEPLDAAAAASHATTRLVVAATDVATGEPAYFEPRGDELIEVLRASSAVPLLYKKFVALGDRRYADGGVSDPIPVEEAYRRGARRIVVVRSRPIAFPGPSRLESTIASLALRGEPGLARAFRDYRATYTRARAWMATPPADCEVIQIAPDRLRTGRTTRERASLVADYARGRAAGLDAMCAW